MDKIDNKYLEDKISEIYKDGACFGYINKDNDQSNLWFHTEIKSNKYLKNEIRDHYETVKMLGYDWLIIVYPTDKKQFLNIYKIMENPDGVSGILLDFKIIKSVEDSNGNLLCIIGDIKTGYGTAILYNIFDGEILSESIILTNLF